MKGLLLDALSGWSSCSWDFSPPQTSRQIQPRRTEVDISGPDIDGDLEIRLEDYGQNLLAFIPMMVLANHLRLAGWTVVPPENIARLYAEEHRP